MSLPLICDRRVSSPTVISLLPTDKIHPNPYQPRRHFDKAAMDELTNSVKTFGIMQPVTVRRCAAFYEIISGERRLRAAKAASLPTVPAIIVNADDSTSALLAIIENICRSDLTFFEEAESLYALHKIHGLTQEEIAQKTGKSQSSVANKIRLLSLGGRIRDIISEGNLTERHARALLKLSDFPEKQEEAAKKIIALGLNVSHAEKMIANMLEEETKKAKRKVCISPNSAKIVKNTLNEAVKLIKAAGVEASVNEKKTDSYIEYIVKVKI